MENHIKNLIFDEIEKSVVRSLRPKPQKPAKDYHDRQIERIDKTLQGLEQTTTTAPQSQNKGTKTGSTTLYSPLPTKEETTLYLKKRLALELYKAEIDLADKLKIFGNPCDCMDYKHNLEIQAVAEELVPKEPENPVFSEIVKWLNDNAEKVTLEASASGVYDDEYPKMAKLFGDFRKRAVGTLSRDYFVSAGDKERVRQKTQEVLEKEMGHEHIGQGG